MKRLLIIFAAGVPLAAAACLPAAASAGTARSAAVPFTCSSISVNAPAGTTVESVTVVSREAGTVTVPPVPPFTDVVEIPDVPAYCDVTVTLSHPGVGDHAKVRIWLPETGWTGRFQALGGSAFAAGDYGAGLAGAIKSGYAAATTDAGVGTYLDTGWA
ncbi:hypothetical protein ACQEVF_19175 [Nonomuraea polychroma]|uniref:hypothetical protein n=1 Tax=Nonomuraea polychroma TaxID=46176 RepID=UPI003D9345AE